MEQEVNDWILRLLRFDPSGKKEISHVCFYDISRTQVMKIAEDYGKSFDVVLVFKFENTF